MSTYRTTTAAPLRLSVTERALGLQLPACTVNNRPFPVALDGKLCTRFEIAEFTTRCKELGVRYLGVCCGAGTHTVQPDRMNES
jgi:betaine-homocysteine S-methyltransferase